LQANNVKVDGLLKIDNSVDGRSPGLRALTSDADNNASQIGAVNDCSL
jgi:hypothetical protein